MEQDAAPARCLWDGCSAGCASPKDLLEHILDEHQPAEWPVLCKWPGCTSVPDGIRRCGFENHVMTHVDYRPHVCRKCGVAFKRAHALADHLKSPNTHRKAPASKPAARSQAPASTAVRCAWGACAHALPDPEALLAHLRADHNAKRECKWAACTFVVTAQGNFVAHLRTHLPKWYRPERCTVPGCGRSFAQRMHLRSHMRVHQDIMGHHAPRTAGKNSKKRKARDTDNEGDLPRAKTRKIVHAASDNDDDEGEKAESSEESSSGDEAPPPSHMRKTVRVSLVVDERDESSSEASAFEDDTAATTPSSGVHDAALAHLHKRLAAMEARLDGLEAQLGALQQRAEWRGEADEQDGPEEETARGEDEWSMWVTGDL